MWYIWPNTTASSNWERNGAWTSTSVMRAQAMLGAIGSFLSLWTGRAGTISSTWMARIMLEWSFSWSTSIEISRMMCTSTCMSWQIPQISPLRSLAVKKKRWVWIRFFLLRWKRIASMKTVQRLQLRRSSMDCPISTAVWRSRMAVRWLTILLRRCLASALRENDSLGDFYGTMASIAKSQLDRTSSFA